MSPLGRVALLGMLCMLTCSRTAEERSAGSRPIELMYVRPAAVVPEAAREPQAATAAPAPASRAAAATGDAGAALAAQPSAHPTAFVLGSSSVMSTFGRIIAADLELQGYEVTRRGVVAAGLARPDLHDLHVIVEEFPVDASTAVVFVYVGVNDGQAIWLRPEEREKESAKWLKWSAPGWEQLYTQRAASLFRSFCERGAQRVIVLLPIEVEDERLERRMQRIRQLQSQATLDTSCAVAVPTDGERGRFTRDGKPLRRRDGVHMSPYGAQLVWDRVRRRVALLEEARGSAASLLRLGDAAEPSASGEP